MSERPANGTFANSGKNGSRVRSQVALIPPNPKTVVDPWWSDTTSPLTCSLAQYAGSTAEGIVPSLQPASVDGGDPFRRGPGVLGEGACERTRQIGRAHV